MTDFYDPPEVRLRQAKEAVRKLRAACKEAQWAFSGKEYDPGRFTSAGKMLLAALEETKEYDA